VLTCDSAGVTSTTFRVSYLLRPINSSEWDISVSGPRRPALFWVLIAQLAAEFLLVLGVAITLLLELLVDTPTSYASAIALTVLAVVAVVWLGAIIVGMLRGQAWTRGAAIVWQVLQFAVGAGSVTGSFASPAIGWPLIAAALVTFVLLFTRPVLDALATRSDRAAS
jgi:hypothetical protein